jgi:Predicted membrane protein (DUF2157)
MTTLNLLKEWETRELVSPEERATLDSYEQTRPVSLYAFLRTLLYAGVTLFTTGAGLLIYLHIDTIGHNVLIVLLALLTLACFYYAFRHRHPFSTQPVNHEAKFADLALLLGCVLFLSLEGYAQYQYNLFGTRYGLATIIPAFLFLFLAYRFDHRGVLSMGLTALASWVGLTVTPTELLTGNDFTKPPVIYTALLLGAALVGLAWFLNGRDIKKHFTFTYYLLGGNLFLIAALAGMVTLNNQLLFAIPLLAASYFFYLQARFQQSFLFLLMAVMYGYFGVTYLIFNNISEEIGIFLGMAYFCATAGGVIWFFLNYKKLLV